ncbi:MAG: DUF5671 domain-containing protein [Chloroflexota bacterium]
MRTVRRLYFYAIAFISLEVILWGLIGLVRATFSPEAVSSVDQLAQALALILVGVPVFGIHWWVAQRSARWDQEEHASGVRAVFLYATLLALLIPVTQNSLALLDRLLLGAFGLSTREAIIGSQQTLSDNLIAMFMNGLIAVYFILVVRDDWKTVTDQNTHAEVRRIYRYFWVGYTLIMVVFGLQQILQYALSRPALHLVGFIDQTWLANGLALLLIGLPLWVIAWRTVQGALDEAAESESKLRLGILYLFSLAGVITVLSSGGIALNVLLKWILGDEMTFSQIMAEISGPASIGIPLGGVWAYYGHWLRRDMEALPDPMRRTGLRRLYNYLLSLMGLGASFIGISMLLSFVIDLGLGIGVWVGSLRDNLAVSLATLLVGLPLWLLTWRPMQAQALETSEEGDHARRSVVRKAYLYLVLFAGVVGGMTFAVRLVFLLLSSLLGERPINYVNEFLNVSQVLILFIILLTYHWQVLRRDGRQATLALVSKHALFHTLVIDPGDGIFWEAMEAAVQKQTPHLPLAVQPITEGISQEAQGLVKAVVLPENLALEPPEALRLWLREFEGSKIIVPMDMPGWFWVGGRSHSLSTRADQAAATLRQLAEGEEVRFPGGRSGWTIVAFVFAALFGIQVLIFIFAFLISTFVD